MAERTPLERRAAAARVFVQPSWDDSRAAYLVRRAEARQRRARITKAVAGSTLAVAAAVLLAWASGPSTRGPSTGGPSTALAVERPEPPITAPDGPTPDGANGIVRFADGSMLVPLAPDTEVLVDAALPSAIALSLDRGAARFEVTPGLTRHFAVQARHLTITVVGTVFTVALGDPEITVEVLEGVVHVTGDGDEVVLGAGDRRTFDGAPRPASAASTALGASETVEVASSGTRPSRERGPAEARDVPEAVPEAGGDETVAWRTLADEGRFDEGYALLLVDRNVLRADDIETLMLAADCARLSGHPAESLAYLHRAMTVGAGDPRAATASFTLGRVLLSQLRRPEEAAEAFAEARALAPRGSLASDALAREVEAWAASGASDRARARAEEYLRLYPEGVHADAVRHHAHLEPTETVERLE
jgi:transmembrane sensor